MILLQLSTNVIIGYDSDPSADDTSNQIVIGKGATGQGDNYAVIGNADVTRVRRARCRCKFNIGSTITSTAADLMADGVTAAAAEL